MKMQLESLLNEFTGALKLCNNLVDTWLAKCGDASFSTAERIAILRGIAEMDELMSSMERKLDSVIQHDPLDATARLVMGQYQPKFAAVKKEIADWRYKILAHELVPAKTTAMQKVAETLNKISTGNFKTVTPLTENQKAKFLLCIANVMMQEKLTLENLIGDISKEHFKILARHLYDKGVPSESMNEFYEQGCSEIFGRHP